MRTDQATRDETGALRGSGAASDRVRNAESKRDRDRGTTQRGTGEINRERSTQDDLILHDDDEAELELPR